MDDGQQKRLSRLRRLQKGDEDRDDLRMLKPQLDKDTLIRKLKDTTGSMLAAESLRQRAEQNWYILYGEPLPS